MQDPNKYPVLKTKSHAENLISRIIEHIEKIYLCKLKYEHLERE